MYAFGWERIIAEAIATADLSILVMDAQVGILIAAKQSTVMDCTQPDLAVAVGAPCSASLEVPSTLGIRHHMVRFRSFWHVQFSL